MFGGNLYLELMRCSMKLPKSVATCSSSLAAKPLFLPCSSAACSGSVISCFVLEEFQCIQGFICFLLFYQII